MACRNRIGSISGRLRGNRFSWLYAATDRGTSWRSDCDFDINDFFTLVHLNKAWSLAGMVPIVFGAGLLLGLLAWSSQSLIPPIIGHVVMDIGLFAYWWTGIAGEFSARPLRETGVDGPFVIACATAFVSLLVTLFAISRLRFWTFVAKL